MILAVALLVHASFAAEQPPASAAPPALVLQAPSTAVAKPGQGSAGASSSATPSHRLVGRVETLRADDSGEVVVSVPPDLFRILQSARVTKLVTEEQRQQPSP